MRYISHNTYIPIDNEADKSPTGISNTNEDVVIVDCALVCAVCGGILLRCRNNGFGD